MESEWELDRIRLYEYRRAHPEWSLPQLAQHLKRSLSWVKKWFKRFREAQPKSLAMFQSRSRAPKHRVRQVVNVVREAILNFRDGLKARYGRVVGPKPILYHLHHDPLLRQQGVYLPRSPCTVWRVLRDDGRIPTRVKEHHPLECPEPMQHWEMDIGQLGNRFEFLTVVDRGTSILVDTQTQPHFDAEAALMAVARMLVAVGLPQKLRFDNDTRFVGTAQSDGFPSPLMRFLWALGVEPDRVQPGKPQHKPFAERSVRTLKYECLALDPPGDWLEPAGIPTVYRDFYNQERANQSLACGNRPPFKAFPTLPTLRAVPEILDPDAWLRAYHRQVFRRRVSSSGMISVGRYDYYVGYGYAQQSVGVLLDAQRRVFQVIGMGKVIRELEIQGLVGQPMAFQDYLKQMRVEAQTAKVA